MPSHQPGQPGDGSPPGIGLEAVLWACPRRRLNDQDGVRRLVRARGSGRRLEALRALRPRDLRLCLPEVKNRGTGKSMGEHCEELARTWKIARLSLEP